MIINLKIAVYLRADIHLLLPMQEVYFCISSPNI